VIYKITYGCFFKAQNVAFKTIVSIKKWNEYEWILGIVAAYMFQGIEPGSRYIVPGKRVW
jgi:hypothetical protein